MEIFQFHQGLSLQVLYALPMLRDAFNSIKDYPRQTRLINVFWSAQSFNSIKDYLGTLVGAGVGALALSIPSRIIRD